MEVGSDDTTHRVRSSEWLVTVNTNKKFKDSDSLREAAGWLQEALSLVFGDKVYMEKIIDVLQIGDTFEDHVGKIHTDVVVENAASGLHAHAHVKACHLSKLHIRVNALRMLVVSYLQKHMSIRNVYIDIKHIKNHSLAVRNYIFKNVRGKTLRMCDGDTEFPDSVTVTHTMSVARLETFSKDRGV